MKESQLNLGAALSAVMCLSGSPAQGAVSRFVMQMQLLGFKRNLSVSTRSWRIADEYPSDHLKES